jgi:hypothetical protein
LAWPAVAADVTAERLINADREPQNWLMNHRTYDAQRYSPLGRPISRQSRPMGALTVLINDLARADSVNDLGKVANVGGGWSSGTTRSASNPFD